MNNQDFERRLCAALDRASDRLPRNADRYEQVLRRGRRQQVRGIGVLAGSAVLVLAVGSGGPVLREISDEARHDTSGSSEQYLAREDAHAPPAARCPKPSRDIGDPRDTGDGSLVPAGAVWAELCGYAVRPHREAERTTLDRGVGRLVALLNDLPAYGTSAGCTGESGPTYRLVLGYPNGRQVVVSFESFGCGIARSGDEYRQGANDLVLLFDDLLPKEGR